MTIINGRKNSGKTELLLRLLCTPGGYYLKYKKIIIISPTFLSQYEKTWSRVKKEGLEVYDGMSDALLAKISKECTKETGPTLIISDDNSESLRTNVSHEKVGELISNSRHANNSFVFLTQSIVQMPTIVRRNADVFVFFASASNTEIDFLWKEVSSIKKRKFMEMFAKAVKQDYGFLVCSSEKGKIKFYESFNKQIICESEHIVYKKSDEF